MPTKPIKRKLTIAIKDTEEDTTLADLTAPFALPLSIGPVVEAKGKTAYAVVEIKNQKMNKAIDAALHAAADKLAEMGITNGDSNRQPRNQHANPPIPGLQSDPQRVPDRMGIQA